MANYPLLIFDWDGTLVDSIGVIVLAVQEACVRCGLPLVEAGQIKALIGLGLPEVLAGLYPHEEVSEYYAAFRGAYLQAFHALEVEPAPFYVGVLEGLEHFREQGYQLAVATGKSRAALDAQLKSRGLEGFFAITRCADETASKPDPLMLRQILDFFGLQSRHALMIGDSGFDLKMAQHASMDAVAVSYGAQSAQLLEVYQPRQVFAQFSQLQSWLAGPASHLTGEMLCGMSSVAKKAATIKVGSC